MTAKHRAYLLILQRPDVKPKFREPELREVRRILGDQVCPFFATESAVAIAFISTENAMSSLNKVSAAIGEQTRISVLELGRDQAQRGLPHHNEWLAGLDWMQGTNPSGS